MDLHGGEPQSELTPAPPSPLATHHSPQDSGEGCQVQQLAHQDDDDADGVPGEGGDVLRDALVGVVDAALHLEVEVGAIGCQGRQLDVSASSNVLTRRVWG